MGAQVDRGEHRAVAVLPTGVRLGLHKWRVDAAHAPGTRQFGRPVRHRRRVRERRPPAGGRVTINPGLRFDHSRAISQDVPEFDALVHETGRIIEGRGTVDTWNIVSPRLGVVIKLDTAGRTMLRANAGRFSQGVLTGEISLDSPRSDQDHDRSRNRQVPQPCVIPVRWNWIPRSGRRTPISTRLAWIARSVDGSRYPSSTSARTAATSSDGTKSPVEYREESGNVDGRPDRAGLEADHAFGGSPLSVDESRRLLADLQRPGHRRRKTPVPRLAGVRVLHAVEGVRAAALERDDRRRRAGRDRGLPARLVRSRGHVRAGSERSHQRATAACPTIARTCSGS